MLDILLFRINLDMLLNSTLVKSVPQTSANTSNSLGARLGLFIW